MLVLSRKIDESIIIDDKIEIQILEICGKQIRIGIQAPKSVIVLREELYQKKITEKNEFGEGIC